MDKVKPFFKTLFFSIYWLLQGLCFSCTNQSGPTLKAAQSDTTNRTVIQSDADLAGNFISQNVIHFDSLSVWKFMQQYPNCKLFEKRIKTFYSNRNYAYAWFDESGLIEPAGNLYNRINNIRDEGWSGNLLYPEEFRAMIENDSTYSTQKPDPEIELMLTAQYFFYAENIWQGKGQAAIQVSEWDLPHKKVSYEKLLDSLLSIPASQLKFKEPVYRQYGLLKDYLKKYRQIADDKQWERIATDKKSYRKDDSSLTIASIRKDLYLAGDLASNNRSMVFDDDLETAVKNYQQRHGLKDDGVIGSSFINELNYPIEKKIEQLMVNMERCRWLPVELKTDYFVVNIPEFRLHAYENDSLVWNMDVVVGTSMNKTAVFSGLLNTVVFSPYWNVPPGIMKKETLPAIRRDKNYLAKNHMEWNGNSIRQKPGPWNALGKVKFLFPNSHNIYLHDTPSKSLFEKERRAFSHGCIRVAEPKRLAMYILRNQPAWTEQKIDAAMNAGKEQYVKVEKPIPVFIAYFTAWVDSKGRLNLRHDIYNHDDRLAKMIIE